MTNELFVVLRDQADRAPSPEEVRGRIRRAVAHRRLRRRGIAVAATAVAAAAALTVPALVGSTARHSAPSTVNVAPAGPWTLPSTAAPTIASPARTAGQVAVAPQVPTAKTTAQVAPVTTATRGRHVSLTAAPAQPGAAVTVGLIPVGWELAPSAITAHLSGGRPGALTIFTAGPTAADVRDLTQTMWLELTTTADTGDAAFNSRVGGKPAAITEPNTRSGWMVLIKENDSLVSTLNLPSALNDLTRDQVVEIAATVVVHDPGQITHG